jgi:hypothetical protein
MKKLVLLVASVFIFSSNMAFADEATEKEVRQTIIDANAATRKNLGGTGDDGYSKDGAVEFWSSGGLMQNITGKGRPQKFTSFNLSVKHINVSTVIPGKVAVANYYSEGSMQPEGGALISNYRTRVTQVYVKEDGKWKIRSGHWSPITGGAGTNQTAVVQ